jgi:hypothetical protein
MLGLLPLLSKAGKTISRVNLELNDSLFDSFVHYDDTATFAFVEMLMKR